MSEDGDRDALALMEDDSREDGDGVDNTFDEANLSRTDSISDSGAINDDELEAIKARVAEMEAEADKLRMMQKQVEKEMGGVKSAAAGNAVSSGFPTPEEKEEADLRSVWIGNVDYGSTAEELESHFHGCGAVHRVTILCDKFTGHPKGFAYIEFADKDSVDLAVALDDSLFRGRQIKVVAKRSNHPGISTTNRGSARGFGRGGRGRSGFRSRGYSPRFRGGGFHPYRGRGRGYYSPY